MSLQATAAGPRTLRLPRGTWRLAGEPAAVAPLPSQPAPGGGSWVQLPATSGIAGLALERSDPAPAAVPEAILQPVELRELPELSDGASGRRWLLGNGLVSAELAAAGVAQLWGADGLPQLSQPLQWCRWRDQGEFWDAWDIAADYREQPLPLEWQGTPELVEQGPLCCRLLWRGRCGSSSLRLDVQLRAASPWLELTLQVDWRQCHELLRLEIPLAQPAVRLAADTAGGVLERPARPVTAREQARWEVPVISWVASQPASGAGGGLAVLLDGPQGVSIAPERLGVSLLRAPTWPDPGADNGLQRLRLALMPCTEGWRQQAVPGQARSFREPLWLRPASPASPGLGQGSGSSPQASLPPLRFGSEALELIGLEPAETAGQVWLTLQNLSPLRQRLQLSMGWRLLEGSAAISPWQLVRLRLALVPPDQSS
jgi:alpha-mannosidase